MRKKVFFLGLIIMLTSCMAESNNMSPLTSSLSGEEFIEYGDMMTEINNDLDKNVYASEISKITTSFPNTSNKNFNEKVSLLKYEIQYYLEVNDNPTLELSARKKVFSTYKKIQGLIKDLPEDEKELIKIHLVKIKTNLTKLKGNLSYNQP